MQIKDNQINIIRIKLDGNIVSEFYHPDIITKSVKTATKGKSLPIRNQGGKTYLVTQKGKSNE